MRLLASFLFSVSFLVASYAQITITNSTFPKVGDTLKTVFNSNLQGAISMGNNAGPHVWDFSALNSGQLQNEVFIEPSKGKDAASFTDANLLISESGQEQYLLSTTNKIEGLGFGGQNPIFGVPVVVRFTKRPVYRTAPLNFISSTSSSGEFKIDLSSNIIPDTLLAGLPIKPDSIRILFSNTSKGIMDAYGTLKMQNKTFDVLRETSESISETKLLVKVFGIWLDPATLFGGNLPGGFGNFLGKDTTITYNFYTNTKKEILVSAEYDTNNELLSVTFANLGGITSSTKEENTIPEFTVYPNPADNILRIKAAAGKESVYFVTITDMSGRVVHFVPTKMEANDTRDIDINHLHEGIYILTIRDQFNTSSRSVRFVKR